MVDGNQQNHQNQNHGNAIVASQLPEEEPDDTNENHVLHNGLPQGGGGQAVLLGNGDGFNLVQNQQNADNCGNQQADEVHALTGVQGAFAHPDDGQEAGANPVVAGGQGTLGLGLQDDVAQAAAHQHGSQGDDEGRNLHVSNEETDEQAEQQADAQSAQHCHGGAPAQIHNQGTGNRTGGSDHGANAQVDVTGQNTQQHTDSQNDNVAVLHDQVVDVHGGQVLALGKDREENVNDNQHDHHAILSHVQGCLFGGLVAHASTSSFLLWAMMQPMMASWVISSPFSSPAISPSLIT